MKLTTLITALVLGTTAAGSAAIAQPAPGDSHEYDAGRAYGWVPPNYPTYDRGNGYGNTYDARDRHTRDHRSDRDRVRRFDRGWVQLIQSVPVPATPDRQNLHLGAQYGRFSQLRIELTGGATFVSNVGILVPGSDRFMVVPVNQWLDNRNPTAVIQLPARAQAINGLVVYTQGGNASYDLMAR